MYWVDTQTGVDVEPARKPVASAVRKFFTEGGAGVPVSVPGGDWYNQITNELLNVLAAAGIDPSKEDDDQLLQAIHGISKAMSAREALRRTYAEAGFNLVPGSFELGGTLTNINDVMLHEMSGKAYSWHGSYPLGVYVVPPDSSPVEAAWVDNSPLAPGAGTVRDGRFALRDWVTVTDFVDVGGVVNSLAFQKAIDSGAKEVFVPNVDVNLDTPIQLPARDITLYGCGRGSVIKGTAAQLIKYPASVSGFQNVDRLSFTVGAGQVGIQMHKVWNAAGKEEVQVTNCHFRSSAVGAKFITVQGIWSGRIQNNEFYGSSKSNDCYGIQFITDDNMSSSVMNLDITGNKMTLVSYPIHYQGRTIGAGGRLEGISINNNKTIASKTGVRLSDTLATSICGNMITDCDLSAIELNGDFDFVITGNLDLFGSVQSVMVQGIAGSIPERGVISGNKIRAGNGTDGVVLKTNVTTPRSIAITGNMIGRVAGGTPTGTGVKIDSSVNVADITITGNAFQQLDTAVDRGAQTGDVVVTGNSYYLVTNTGAGMKSTQFTKSYVITMVGGASSEAVFVDLPVGVTNKKPEFASMTGTGIGPGQSVIGFYDYDASTASTLKFNVMKLDHTVINPGALRVGVVANLF